MERSVELEPNALGATLLLVECYARQGEQDKAVNLAKRVLEIDPSFRVKHLEDVMPTKDTQALARHLNALRKSGLPE